MKKEIDAQEYAKFQRESNIYAVMFIVLLVVPIPLIMFLEWLGVALYAVLFVVTIVFAFRVEKYKKKYDIQTYKEIIAFTEDNSLTELEKAREEGKRPYQKILLAVGSALLTLIIAFIMIAVIKALF